MHPEDDAERFDACCAVIGAGPAGLATAKALRDRGITCQVFEAAATPGGMWQITTPGSAAYPTLQCNSSRNVTQFRSFPMPKSWPDFPTYQHMADYLDAFVAEFELADLIELESTVTDVEPVPGPGLPGHNGWAVTTRGNGTRYFEHVIVASGHHSTPHLPELPGNFRGDILHSRDYADPDIFLTKRVLVVGAGNSGTDIAVDSARRAEHTILATRHPLHVLPRYVLGRPYDQLRPGVANLLPAGVERSLFDRFVRVTPPDDAAAAEPEESRNVPEAPPVAPELPDLVASGDVELKPAPRRLSGDRVTFSDGTRTKVDVIVYATGYDVSLPFLRPDVLTWSDNRLPLYRRVVAPQRPGLFFIGFVDTVGAVLPVLELQAEWVADVVAGVAVLPGRTSMRKSIEEDMQTDEVSRPLLVDLWRYSRTVKQERSRRTAKPTLRQRLAAR